MDVASTTVNLLPGPRVTIWRLSVQQFELGENGPWPR